ncbi:MAG: UbiA family prenyltransferase [Chromatiales bacterium]|nr:UbiA family prenyltransferase [Chromatiales bacterium]
MTSTTDETRPGVEPLCVDMDGTLVQTDLLYEALFSLLKSSPSSLFALPAWLYGGKAALKHEIAARVEIDYTTLPYQQEFLEYLRNEKARGRELVLATAANATHANRVAEHLGLFDAVLASGPDVNLSGSRKLEAIRAQCPGGFSYAGNTSADVPIWEAAREIVAVNPSLAARGALHGFSRPIRTFTTEKRNGLRAFPTAIRLHQWVKNLLVFVPVITAHQLLAHGTLATAATAFVVFGLCTASVYLLNDLLDLREDRLHATKRLRPIAAGLLSIQHAVFYLFALLVLAFVGAWLLLPAGFLLVLLIYYLLTVAYSLALKRLALVDIITLAALYTLRIIAGGVATGIELSFWLLAFSMFLFTSLALAKRYTEIARLSGQQALSAPGRGYRVGDLAALMHFGVASAQTSVLILALYLNSEAVSALYTEPRWLWLLCPIVMYLTARIWLLAHRDELNDDPVLFVLRDRLSLLLGAAGLVLVWLGS